jgi:FixJ family two-component response regulator
MKEENLLRGKRIIIVDDEKDVLDTLRQLLPMCEITTAATFEEAKSFLETKELDLAILDIMGVNGYELLDIAKKKGIIAVMLTAHAFSVESTVKSFKKGAVYFLPKDEMHNIAAHLMDMLRAGAGGESLWARWLEKFDEYYERRFGPHWKDKDKDFWDKLPYVT